MKEFTIKITGGGTRQEIARALRAVADGIDETLIDAPSDEELDGAEWEDPILMTTISTDEEFPLNEE